MKTKTFWTAVLMVFILIAISVSPVMAAKPDGSNGTADVIARSNGFPSGEHFNLNIHGKSADYIGDPTAGGNSVFILEYGESTIQYVTNKKSSVTELYVLDPLAEAFDGDAARVQLPYEADGYYVFGRILGKPNNGNDQTASNIILRPNEVVGAYNDVSEDPDFGTYTGEEDELTGSLLDLGLIVGPNMYIAEDEQYVRFATETTKGKSKATNITDLFTYTGWVLDSVLDTSGDGIVDIDDIPLGDYDGDIQTADNQDYNNDGSVDEADVEAWLTDQSLLESPTAWYYDSEWIMNIADLVITEQGLVNDGTKLLQVRFYPVDTTVFTP